MRTLSKVSANRKLVQETDHHIAYTFKALGDITRLRIFRLLTDHPEISVSDIAKALHISTPLASLHIKVLVHAKLVKKNRTGKRVFPELDRRNPLVLELVKAVQKIIVKPPVDSVPKE